jgi:hypothetical protein
MENYLLDHSLHILLVTVHFPELRNARQTLSLYDNKQVLEYFQEPSSILKIILTFFVLSPPCVNYFSVIFSIKSGRCVNITRAS